ncbi:MAG: tetraacyldisaccharide 4'-kinase [Desulfatitalea sp.]
MPAFFVKTKERIRTIIEGRDAGRWPHTSNILSGASWVYGLLSQTRYRLYGRGMLKSRCLPCCVISVGNLTAGGTGKTPMTIYIARHLQSIGYRVVVLSRGYGGRAEKKGGIVSDGLRICMDPDSAGDEAFMMAAKLVGIPVLVGQDRYRSGVNAIRYFQAEVIVLDDGYQHLRLQRDLNLLLLDARYPFGNGYLLPRGPLRVPISSSIRADAIILTRCGPDNRVPALPKEIKATNRVFRSRHVPALFEAIRSREVTAGGGRLKMAPLDTAAILGTKVFGFSGIANNVDFRRSLLSLGVSMKGFLEFDDHHRYSDGDLETIQMRCRDEGAEWLATTEKDFYRLCHRFSPTVPLMVVSIEIEFFPNPEGFNAFVDNACQASDARI